MCLVDHPSVHNSPSVGAIGILAVKKTIDGIYVYFAHNTDSFVCFPLSFTML
jgi:taspase (threonine aspartase 1)